MDRAQPLTISVVIPTRNRRVSVDRVLRAIAAQTRTPHEIIVVDASDDILDAQEASAAAGQPVRVVGSAPSVCVQRNLGVQLAGGSHVFLCDDDIEPDPGYLDALAAYLEQAADGDGQVARPGAVSGVLVEPDQDHDAGGDIAAGTARFAPPSLRHLLFTFVFQLDVHADVAAARAVWPAGALLRALQRWYARRGNTWSLAGWPLITRVDTPVTTTAVYGLGASLVRREWLLSSPYDEGLGPHGVGDNYGVALGFPGKEAIALLVDVPVLHHRDPVNRPAHEQAFVDRVMALDRFAEYRPDAGLGSRVWLIWSLLGRALVFLARGPRPMASRALGAALKLALGRNSLRRHAGKPRPVTARQ